MGTPDFAVPVLSALMAAGHEIVGAYTQPDRPVGRGKRVRPSPVKEFATERGLTVFQPASLKGATVLEELKELAPGVMVVAAYGLFLPPTVLQVPPLDSLNVHPSTLPGYRGPSPVQTAILNGDETTGVTIIKLDEGMDTGPIVAGREIEIGSDETAADLTMRLFEMGARLLVEVLPGWEAGAIEARPQDETAATVTKRLSRADGRIDWSRDAAYIDRQVRAFQPWPGTFTQWNGRLLKVLDASPVDDEGHDEDSTGLVIALEEGRIAVAAGQGILELATVQLEGRSATPIKEFTLGHPTFVGSQVG